MTLAEIIIATSVIAGIYFLVLSFKIDRINDKINEIEKKIDEIEKKLEREELQWKK